MNQTEFLKQFQLELKLLEGRFKKCSASHLEALKELDKLQNEVQKDDGSIPISIIDLIKRLETLQSVYFPRLVEGYDDKVEKFYQFNDLNRNRNFTNFILRPELVDLLQRIKRANS